MGWCILSGAHFTDQRLPIRLAIFSWIFFIFIISYSYSTTLISHVSSPLLKPVINSLHDIPHVSGLRILVRRWNALDTVFLVRLKFQGIKFICIVQILIVVAELFFSRWYIQEAGRYVGEWWWSALSHIPSLFEKNDRRLKQRLYWSQSLYSIIVI